MRVVLLHLVAVITFQAAPVLPGQAAEPNPPRFEAQAGASYGPGYMSAYAAGVFAPSGTLYDPGLRLRGLIGAGRYDHDLWARHEVQVPFATGEAMIGYAFRLGPGWMTAYAGAHAELHHNPDADASVNGLLLGAKGQAELWMPLASGWSASGTAALSSVQWGHYASAKLERDIGRWALGPEVALLGGDTYAHLRAGLAASLDIGGSRTSFSGGWSFDLDEDDGDGLYAGLGWSRRF